MAVVVEATSNLSRVVSYRNRDDLFEMIDYYLTHPQEREAMRRDGHEETKLNHTYRHRCAELIEIVERNL